MMVTVVMFSALYSISSVPNYNFVSPDYKSSVPPIKEALLPSHSSAFQTVTMKSSYSVSEHDVRHESPLRATDDMERLRRENEDLREQLLSMRVSLNI